MPSASAPVGLKGLLGMPAANALALSDCPRVAGSLEALALLLPPPRWLGALFGEAAPRAALAAAASIAAEGWANGLGSPGAVPAMETDGEALEVGGGAQGVPEDRGDAAGEQEDAAAGVELCAGGVLGGGGGGGGGKRYFVCSGLGWPLCKAPAPLATAKKLLPAAVLLLLAAFEGDGAGEGKSWLREAGCWRVEEAEDGDSAGEAAEAAAVLALPPAALGPPPGCCHAAPAAGPAAPAAFAAKDAAAAGAAPLPLPLLAVLLAWLSFVFTGFARVRMITSAPGWCCTCCSGSVWGTCGFVDLALLAWAFELEPGVAVAAAVAAAALRGAAPAAVGMLAGLVREVGREAVELGFAAAGVGSAVFDEAGAGLASGVRPCFSAGAAPELVPSALSAAAPGPATVMPLA